MPLKEVETLSRICARSLLFTLFATTAALLAIVHCVFHSFDLPKGTNAPLLDSGGFTLLAIVVALSAYLRSVAAAADEKREKIRSGKMMVLYPPGKTHTDEKLKALGNSYDKLEVGVPFMIWLTIFIAVRLLLGSISRLGFYWLNTVLFFRIFDVLILEWLFLAFAMLAILHHYGYRRDERLRVGMPTAAPKPEGGDG